MSKFSFSFQVDSSVLQVSSTRTLLVSLLKNIRVADTWVANAAAMDVNAPSVQLLGAEHHSAISGIRGGSIWTYFEKLSCFLPYQLCCFILKTQHTRILFQHILQDLLFCFDVHFSND